ncbi:MAG: helix-hairpin-helix domain-containing protein [Deltaproteobacteria bacterium]|nr:helix-hairpin-helix domain-containing protein [Deltaproteobacteria bacterium]
MKTVSRIMAVMVLASSMLVALNASAADGTSPGVTININTATITELGYLPGVGESKAEAIVKYRTNRQFKKIEDLMRVKGIGRKSFKKMRAYLSVKGETTAKKKIKISK